MNKQILPFICFWLLFALPVGWAAELPVIHLEGALLSTVESKPGSMRIETENGAFESDITLKYRGTYSASFTLKRNYTIHLKTENGEQRKESLLGLRKDDDYALLGGYSDPSRLRILVGLDLYREYCGAAPAGALCEVYFGTYYKGVYTLVERPERKTAGVPKDGALYRVLAAKVDGADILSGDAATPPQEESWYNIGKIYPEASEGWQEMEKLHAFLRADDAVFAQKIGDYLDLQAFADYYLFVNLIGATDNMQKNLFIAWDGEKMYPMPWDLDAAFGRLYNAELSDPAAWYSSSLFDRLLKTDAFQMLLRERYRVLRAGFLPENVRARFEAYAAVLTESGALSREAERFSVYTDVTTQKSHLLDVYGEIDLIERFMAQRIALLDNAFLQ